MNSITILHGDKGGVGKSFSAMAYLDWRLSTGMPVVAVDSDTRNHDINRLFSNHIPVVQANLAREEGWIDLANALESDDTDAEWVVSLPAGIGAGLEAQMSLISDVLAATDRSLRAMWVLGETPDSIALLGEFQRGLKKVEAPSELVVVRNGFWLVNNPRAFDLWDGSKTRKAALASGATELELPALTKRVNLDQPPSVLMDRLPLGDRLALGRWTKTVAKAFGQLDDAGEEAA